MYAIIEILAGILETQAFVLLHLDKLNAPTPEARPDIVKYAEKTKLLVKRLEDELKRLDIISSKLPK